MPSGVITVTSDSVTATAFGTGNRLLAGVPVAFSTTTGTLSAGTATTGADGTATVTLNTNRAATVTAVVGSKSGTAAITVTTAPTITLATTPASPTPGQLVTLTVTPAAGTSPSVVVQWGDGSSSSLSVVSGARSTTHAYSSQGVFTVTATATEGSETFSTSTSVSVGAPPSVALTVNVNAGVISGTPVNTAPTTFVFTVTPAAGVGARTVTLVFGDGESIALGAISSATQVTHRYTAVGTYTVRATEVDVLGNTTTAVVVITVTASATT